MLELICPAWCMNTYEYERQQEREFGYMNVAGNMNESWVSHIYHIYAVLVLGNIVNVYVTDIRGLVEFQGKGRIGGDILADTCVFTILA